MNLFDRKPAENFGQRLKRLRLAAGLTQEQLADKAGVASAVINQSELGRTRMSREAAKRIARALNMTLEEFVDGAQDELSRRPLGRVSKTWYRIDSVKIRVLMVIRDTNGRRLAKEAGCSGTLITDALRRGKATLDVIDTIALALQVEPLEICGGELVEV